MIYICTPRITNSKSELKKILNKEAPKSERKRERKKHSLNKNY